MLAMGGSALKFTITDHASTKKDEQERIAATHDQQTCLKSFIVHPPHYFYPSLMYAQRLTGSGDLALDPLQSNTQ